VAVDLEGWMFCGKGNLWFSVRSLAREPLQSSNRCVNSIFKVSNQLLPRWHTTDVELNK
jgi:hypothetical protein